MQTLEKTNRVYNTEQITFVTHQGSDITGWHRASNVEHIHVKQAAESRHSYGVKTSCNILVLVIAVDY